MRLNGWQRTGIVASICWAIGGAYFEATDMARREREFVSSITKVEYDLCRGEQDRAIEASRSFSRDCVAESHDNFTRVSQIAHKPRWSIALVALAPIPIGWLLVFILIRIWRWIRRGFRDYLKEISTR